MVTFTIFSKPNALKLNWNLPYTKCLEVKEERVRVARLVTCCNYFSLKKKKQYSHNKF